MGIETALTQAAVDKLPKRLRQLYDILKAKGIDLADLDGATVNKVGFWQAMHKDDDGEAIITDLARIELAPAWDQGPAWPVVQPGPMPRARPKAKVRRPAKGWQDAYLVPDMQIGYYLDGDGGLVPIHDEAAMAVALAIAKDLQPARIVFHGQPVRTTEDWQQGVGIVRYQPGDGLHAVEHVEILSGWAMWRGQEYRA